jgi:glycosyltransferase involved in cell wall biosynthesis
MNTPKKILVIAGGAYVSGAEKVTIDILEGFTENCHRVHCMVSGWNDGDFIGRIKKLNLPYTPIKLGWYYATKIWWSLDSLVNYPKAIWDFIRLKRKFKPDIVYTISYRQILLLYPFFNKNIVYHIHDPNSHSKQSIFFLKLIDSKVKQYIAVSDFIKQDLVKCGIEESKIDVVHNGVNSPRTNFIKTYMPNSILRIGIVGQIIDHKGHRDLIAALILLDKKVKFELFIYGRGADRFKNNLIHFIYEHRLQDKIFWKGFVHDSSEIYRNIDVLVAPTKSDEPFGLVALEAGMYSIPAIVTKSGGFPESIKDNQTGFIINKSSPKEIAEKLTLLFSKPELLNEMGINAYNRISNNFTLTKTKQKINNLFLNIQ